MASTIDTRFIDVLEWTAQTTTLLAPYGTIPKLIDPQAWRDWARVVVALPAVSALVVPRPDSFAHWQDWAQRFNQLARLLTS